MLREQVAMVRNSAGAGLRQQPNARHFGRLRNPGQTHLFRSKKRTSLGKRGCMVSLAYVLFTDEGLMSYLQMCSTYVCYVFVVQSFLILHRQQCK